jgi:hypothetical protein
MSTAQTRDPASQRVNGLIVPVSRSTNREVLRILDAAAVLEKRAHPGRLPRDRSKQGVLKLTVVAFRPTLPPRFSADYAGTRFDVWHRRHRVGRR